MSTISVESASPVGSKFVGLGTRTRWNTSSGVMPALTRTIQDDSTMGRQLRHFREGRWNLHHNLSLVGLDYHGEPRTELV
ncbi:hypothetical protein L917_04089 [Phytophthora nicotianae]|uniref:Uncharacterized protein n=1 Tax=Phytophthora nicotianae TaxID=4792 RepID=W2LQE5_PHYNI|nr:hypothetical protein L917_04089 [Phytophthora nicotianae]